MRVHVRMCCALVVRGRKGIQTDTAMTHSPPHRRYRSALSLQPTFPAAQLGLAETLLAAARLHARMGAAGAAAAELREAAQQASACARGGGAHMVRVSAPCRTRGWNSCVVCGFIHLLD